MKFIIDQPLSPALCDFFKERGHEAVHTKTLNFEQVGDVVIWRHAALDRSVIVTKDTDFLQLSKARSDDVRVLFVGMGNVSNRALLERMGQIWIRLQSELLLGERVVEIR